MTESLNQATSSLQPVGESSVGTPRRFHIARTDASTTVVRQFDLTAVEKRWTAWTRWKDEQITTLSTVIKAQQRLLDYNSYYSAFLLGQLTEEEFHQSTAEFAYEPSKCDEADLAVRIRYLLDLTTLEFTVNDLADIFQCESESVQQAISLLGQQEQLEKQEK